MNTNQNVPHEDKQLPDTYCRNTLKFRHFPREAGVGLFIFMLAVMLAGCHTQRSVVAEQSTHRDSLHVMDEVRTINLTDSILQEFCFEADSLAVMSHPDSVVQIIAKGAKLTQRKERKQQEQTTVAIRDTISVHIRDSTHIAKSTDSTGIYRPPELWLLVFILLAVYFSFKLLVRS